MRPLFITRAGRLTRYALACGYVERVQGFTAYSQEVFINLEQLSNDVFEVAVYVEGEDREAKRDYYQFESLPEARAAFDREARFYLPRERKQARAKLLAERARLEAKEAISA